MLFVAAAGNAASDNDAVPTWPANCPASSLVSVAATTSSDGLASFSNIGASKVDLGAPGDTILSTVPGGGYGYKSGTSMAAPHVSGVAAVLIGEDPSLEPWQVKAALTGGGDPIPALAGTTASGRRLSLAGSLGVAASGVGADATAPDPLALVSPAEGLATTQASPLFRWSPASDAQSGVAGYRLVVDGALAASVPAGTTTATPSSPLADGSHAWTVVARDGIGNERSAVPRALVVDRTPPSAPAPAAPADLARVTGPSVTLSWAGAADAVTGVASYRVSVDGVAVATLAASARNTRVAMTRGAHTWQVQAVDGVGNASSGRDRALTVTGVAAPAPSRAIDLGRPPRVVPGARPVLPIHIGRGGAIAFSVRPSSRARALGAFTRHLGAGSTRVTFPAALSRKLRAGAVYVVTARGAGTVDSVRFAVARRR